MSYFPDTFKPHIYTIYFCLQMGWQTLQCFSSMLCAIYFECHFNAPCQGMWVGAQHEAQMWTIGVVLHWKTWCMYGFVHINESKLVKDI